MKKILSMLMILLAVSAVTVLSASQFFVLQEGDTDEVELYSPDGSRIDSMSEVGESGMVIRTEGETKKFVSDFGDIYLQNESMLAVTGFDAAEPSLYLLYGEMSIDLRTDFPVSLYTPSMMAVLPGSGEYRIVSTDADESVFNFSEKDVTVYDGLRGVEENLSPMESVSLMEWPRTTKAVSAEEYYSLSMTASAAEETVPAEEPITEPAEEPVTRVYEYAGYTLTAVIDSGKAELEYPAFIADSDTEAFFAAENEKYGLADLGVSYVLNGNGKATISYPAEYSNETAAAELDLLVEDLIAYLSAPAITETAEEEPVTEPEEEPAAEPAEEPVTRVYEYAGYTLTAVIDSGKAELEYPAFIADSDVIEFFAAENEKYGLADLGVSYVLNGNGSATISYPAEYSNETAAAELDLLVEDLIAYLSAPAITETEEPEEMAEVPDAPFIISPVITIGEGPAVPSAPTLSYSAEIVEDAAEIPSVPSFKEPVITVITGAPEEEASVPEAPQFTGTVTETEEEPAAEMPAESAESSEMQSTEAKESTAAPVITGERIKNKLGFDIHLAARAYADQRGNSLVRASVQPYLTYGSFVLGLNIDPFSIYDTLDADDNSIADWIGFASDFISEIRFRSLDESTMLTIDRYTGLDGDSAGLFSGRNHAWDGMHSALSLNHTFSSEYYAHRVWFSDLSFRSDLFSADSGYGLGGAEIAISAGDAYPLTFSVGTLAAINPDEIDSYMLFPEASLYLPFIFSGDLSFGFRAGAATFLDGKNMDVNPFTENGMLLSFMLPIEYKGITIEAGAAYSTKKMHYGMLSSPYVPSTGDDLITLSMKAGYEGRWFGLEAEGWFDLTTDGLSIVEDNSWFDGSAYIDLYGIRLFGGYRTQFSDVKERSEYYAGLSSAIGPVAARLQLGYNNADKFSLTFAGTVSTFGNGKENSGYEPSIPVSFDIETGIRHYVGEDMMPVFLVTPRVTIGEGDYLIALRAPLQMTFSESGAERDFVLAGFSGRDEWNFGADESGMTKSFHVLTDTAALIDRIKLGDADSSILYLEAERGYYKSGTLFSFFGSEDALSVRAGFNFPNLSLSIYSDNAEAPHISEMSLSFFPTEDYDLAFRLSFPGELLMKDEDNYALLFYPEFRIDIPFVRNHFTLSLFALGEVSTIYQNGLMESSKVIYDFDKKAMYDYMTGAEIEVKAGGFTVTAKGGINSGKLRPAMFNAFTAAQHTVAASTIEELSDLTGESGAPMRTFGELFIAYSSDILSIGAGYAVGDIEALISGDSALDILSLGLSAEISGNTTLYAAFAKDSFSTSFTDADDFMDYMKNGTLFSVGLDFSFGHAGFSAELRTEYLPDAAEGSYVNIPALSGTSVVSLTVKTRFSF